MAYGYGFRRRSGGGATKHIVTTYPSGVQVIKPLRSSFRRRF